MPQIFKIGGYIVYFWSNESDPLEPVHVHISEGIPTANATKIWITSKGKCSLCNNNSKIPPKTLKLLMRIIESQNELILSKWEEHFKTVRYII